MAVAGLALAATGMVVLAGSIAGASHDQIRPGEQRVFAAINRLPGWLEPVLWLPMQFGNLVVGTVAGLAVAWWAGSWMTALSVVLAALLKLVAERLIRSRMRGFAEVRQRPGTSEPGAILRGDVPAAGASFPSGHVLLAFAVACVAAPHFPGAVVPVPYVLAALVALGRVYVGAHNPLDVTAGLGAGLLVGGLLSLLG